MMSSTRLMTTHISRKVFSSLFLNLGVSLVFKYSEINANAKRINSFSGYRLFPNYKHNPNNSILYVLGILRKKYKDD